MKTVMAMVTVKMIRLWEEMEESLVHCALNTVTEEAINLYQNEPTTQQNMPYYCFFLLLKQTLTTK